LINARELMLSLKRRFSGVYMPSQPVAYALGGTLTEQQRLIAQAQGLEVHAEWLLDQIGLLGGQRTVDVGCGPIGILNLLSDRVGRDGIVIGVEREPRFFDMAQAEVGSRRLQNVKLVKADALDTGLERNSYDFVHERLLLINFPPASQHALLTEMIALLKPGGTIAVQEFDSASYVCYPEHPSWNILLSIWNDTFHDAGGNEFVGRSIGRLLRSAGVENVSMKVHVEVAKVGEYRRTHLLSLLQSMEDSVVASGRITKPELAKHITALSEHLADPETTLIDKLVVQAWGQKRS
jgi:ubiquinone/menaquinone biosynthesis C-methylase UbiE